MTQCQFFIFLVVIVSIVGMAILCLLWAWMVETQDNRIHHHVEHALTGRHVVFGPIKLTRPSFITWWPHTPVGTLTWAVYLQHNTRFEEEYVLVLGWRETGTLNAQYRSHPFPAQVEGRRINQLELVGCARTHIVNMVEAKTPC